MYSLLQYIEPKPGNFIDVDTDEVVGSHKGTFCCLTWNFLTIYDIYWWVLEGLVTKVLL